MCNWRISHRKTQKAPPTVALSSSDDQKAFFCGLISIVWIFSPFNLVVDLVMPCAPQAQAEQFFFL